MSQGQSQIGRPAHNGYGYDYGYIYRPARHKLNTNLSDTNSPTQTTNTNFFGATRPTAWAKVDRVPDMPKPPTRNRIEGLGVRA